MSTRPLPPTFYGISLAFVGWWNELLFGCYRLAPLPRRQAAIALIKLIGFEREVEMGGLTPSFVDGQIAAIARTRGLTLVTRNVADLADFQGLPFEDWAA